MSVRQWWRDCGGRNIGWTLRRWRDRQLIKLKLERSNRPPILVEQIQLNIRNLGEFIVARLILDCRDFTFMQIGGFELDDDIDDISGLISRHRLRGLIVEPQLEAYEKLVLEYSDQPNVTILQAAISEEDGTRNLYRPVSSLSGLASLDRGHLRRHGVEDGDIAAVPVRTYTVESAMRECGMTHIDFLQIDAEAHDYNILQSIDYTRIAPAAIRFESKHMSPADLDNVIGHMSSFGYRFIMEQKDVIAIRLAVQGDEFAGISVTPVQGVSTADRTVPQRTRSYDNC